MALFKPDSLLTETKNSRKFIPTVFPGLDLPIPRGSAEVERRAHNPKVGGSIPSPATIPVELPSNIILGYN